MPPAEGGSAMAVFAWIIGLVVLVIDIAAIVDVIRRPDLGGGAKTLWILLLLIVPVIGVIVYVIARPSVVDFGEDPDRAERAGWRTSRGGRVTSSRSRRTPPDR